MSLASIEARASALMSMHKEQLTRALAHFEHITGHLAEEVEDEFKRLFGMDDPAPTIEQGTDPVITDVPPASTEPEQLEPATGHAAVEGDDAAPATQEQPKDAAQ